MYVCTYVRMYVCTYVRMYVCTYVRMFGLLVLSSRTHARTVHCVASRADTLLKAIQCEHWSEMPAVATVSRADMQLKKPCVQLLRWKTVPAGDHGQVSPALPPRIHTYIDAGKTCAASRGRGRACQVCGACLRMHVLYIFLEQM